LSKNEKLAVRTKKAATSRMSRVGVSFILVGGNKEMVFSRALFGTDMLAADQA